MGGLRKAACTCCGVSHIPLDLLAGQPWCSSCLENLILGRVGPIKFAASQLACQACGQPGTIPYRAALLHCGPRPSHSALHMCPRHFQDYVGLRLSPPAYLALCRGCRACGVNPLRVYHLTFYDEDGLANSPLDGCQEEDSRL